MQANIREENTEESRKREEVISKPVKPEGFDKEKFKHEIITEVKAQLLRDQVVKEITKELQPKTWNEIIHRFSQHPAFLLLTSFALTGLIGGWVTIQWQAREWNRQQEKLIIYRQIETKNAIIDELIKAAGTRNASIREIVEYYRFPFAGGASEADISKYRVKLDTSKKEWNVVAETVRQKLDLYFKNEVIKKQFNRIVNTQNVRMFPRLYYILKDSKSQPGNAREWLRGTISDLEKENNNLRSLIQLMRKEVDELQIH